MSFRAYLPAAAAVAALVLVTGTAGPAHAEFRVCNQTLSLFNLAIGYPVEDDLFETEGWWTLAANSCVSLIKGPLDAQYVYLYGTDIYGEPAIVGSSDSTAMCVGAKQFEIRGKEDCWVRGYERVRFLEVDTGHASRWTVFIRDR